MKIVSSTQDDGVVPSSEIPTGNDCVSTGTDTASIAVVQLV